MSISAAIEGEVSIKLADGLFARDVIESETVQTQARTHINAVRIRSQI